MYGNYPAYNPVPMDPAMVEMQERLKRMQQQAYRSMPSQPAMPMYGIKGRPVTNIEEARAAQIDFDGSTSYFPCPAERKIFAKGLDLNGNPVFEVYQLVTGNVQQQPAYVESSAFMALQQRVEQLEAALKGANNNVQPITTNANAGQQSQPASANATDVRQQPSI